MTGRARPGCRTVHSCANCIYGKQNQDRTEPPPAAKHHTRGGPGSELYSAALQVEDGGGLLRRAGATDGDGFPVLQLDRVAGGEVPALRHRHRLDPAVQYSGVEQTLYLANLLLSLPALRGPDRPALPHLHRAAPRPADQPAVQEGNPRHGGAGEVPAAGRPAAVPVGGGAGQYTIQPQSWRRCTVQTNGLVLSKE